MRDNPSSPESFKPSDPILVTVTSMNATPLIVYCGSVLVLWFKFIVSISIQGRERRRASSYCYPEDASHWRGRVKPDSDLCGRAQSLLRNDSEGQSYFLICGLLYLLVDAWPPGALLYFPAYALSRVLHGYFLLRGRQPQRTRAFGVGVFVVTLMAVHVGVAAVELSISPYLRFNQLGSSTSANALFTVSALDSLRGVSQEN